MFWLLVYIQLRSDRRIFNFIGWITIYEPHVQALAPFCRLSPQNLRPQWKKRSHVALREYRYTHPRKVFGLGLIAEQGKKLWQSQRREWERERGRRRGRTFACRATVWLRCASTTHAFCSFVPQPAALEFSVESENGFLSFSRRAPIATRATNCSSTFTPSFPRACRCSPFLLPSFSLPPHCFLFPIGMSRPLPLTNNTLFYLQHRLPSLYYTL